MISDSGLYLKSEYADYDGGSKGLIKMHSCQWHADVQM